LDFELFTTQEIFMNKDQMLDSFSSDREYVLSGKPYRRSDGKVFQSGSQLSLHNGFWWYDVGCPIAPEGQEVNLPLIDMEPDGKLMKNEPK
jgi:hypothetical protein